MLKLTAILTAMTAIAVYAFAALAQSPTTPSVSAIACAYSSVVQSAASGNFVLAQCDTNGNLKTTTAASTPANLNTNQVSVAATATQIAASRAGRNAITIVNSGTTDVFIGTSAVTATTGVLLPGTKGASFTISGSAAVYGIVATGTQTVSYFETY